jgi:hypothetical protein
MWGKTVYILLLPMNHIRSCPLNDHGRPLAAGNKYRMIPQAAGAGRDY